MRLTSTRTLLIPLTLLFTACGGGGGNSDETGATPATTTATTGTAGATDTTGTPGTNTSDPTTTGLTSEPTTGSSTATSEPITSSTGPGPVDTGSTGDTTSTAGDTGSTGTTDASSSSDTGQTPAGPCVSDQDCALHNDCCSCYGLPADQVDGQCKKRCEQPMCDQLGIDQAVCRFGVCITEEVHCDGSKVACDEAPPDCPEGQVPQVVGVCWSGLCVDAVSCDVVADCGACPAGTMCVQLISKQETPPSCEPIPAECDGKVDCKCAGEFVCTGIFNACNESGGNQLTCGCPTC